MSAAPEIAPGHGLPRRANAVADLLLSPAGFHVFVTVVLAALFLMRGLLFPGIGGDDGEQLVFSQFLARGYQTTNPPLYAWMVGAATGLLGPSAFSVMLVRFALLWLLYLALWRVARRMLGDPGLAGCAALSLFLLYYVGWDSIHGYTHSILVAVLYAATLLLLLRIDAEGRTLDYILLGLALGLGFMAKYAFWVFAIALLVAAIADARMRRRLFDLRIALTLALAIAVFLPHLLWILERPETPFAASRPWSIGAAARSLGDLALAVVGFLAPLWLLWLAIFPRVFARDMMRARDETARWRRFLGIFFATLLALMVLVAVGLRPLNVRTHYMFVLVLAPLFFFARLAAFAPTTARLRVFALCAAVGALLAVGGLPIKYAFEPLRCTGCQHHLPYPAWAAGLRAAGFRGGTILADWHPHPLAGNFRIRFPEARIVDAKHAEIRPPLAASTGQCLIVWTPDAAGTRVRQDSVLSVATDRLGVRVPSDAMPAEIAAPLVMGRGRQAKLAYLLLPGQGDCR